MHTWDLDFHDYNWFVYKKIKIKSIGIKIAFWVLYPQIYLQKISN